MASSKNNPDLEILEEDPNVEEDDSQNGLSMDSSLDDPEAYNKSVPIVLRELSGDHVSGNGSESGGQSSFHVEALNPQERERVNRLVRELGSDTFRTREAAELELSRFGLRALSDIFEASKSENPEIRNRARRTLERVLGNSTEPLASRGEALRQGDLSPGSIRSFTQLITDADRLASDPDALQTRRDQLDFVARNCPGPIAEQIAQAQAELQDPAHLAASLRVKFADASLKAGDNLMASRLLLEAMNKDPEIVKDNHFISQFNRADGKNNPELMQAFVQAGGDITKLRDSLPPLLAGPQSERRDMMDILRSFEVPFGGTLGWQDDHRGTAQEQRLNWYNNNKESAAPEMRVQVLADYYISAGNDAERQTAMQLLAQERQAGNIAAQNAEERLPFMSEAVNPYLSLLRTWRPMDAVMLDGRFLPATNQQERLAAIQEMLALPPLHRPQQTHHEAIHLILDFYRNSENREERQQALNWLKDEVQAGNLSASLALRQLATSDAAFRFSDARQVLNDPAASPEARQRAEAEQREALLDLMRQELADRRNSDPSFAGSFLEHLARSPGSGVNPREFERIREDARQESQTLEQQTRDTVVQAVRGSGPQRDQALEQLRLLADQQYNTERRGEYRNIYNFASTAAVVQDIQGTMASNPNLAAQHMLRLYELSGSNPKAMEVISRINGMGEEGGRLMDALQNGNLEGVQQALQSETLANNLQDSFRSVSQELERIQSQAFNPRNALEVLLANPELREQLLQEAAQEDQENRSRVEAAVHDYLLRDGAYNQLRTDLLAALPANGPLSLAADSPVRAALERGVNQRLLPDQARQLAEKLLSGGSLTEAEVGQLRQSLERTGQARRQDALARINEVSRDTLETGTQFEATLKAIESIENARSIHDAIERVRQGGEGRQQALQDLQRLLSQLNTYATDGYMHPHSIEYLNKLNDSVPGGLEALRQRLQSDDPAVVNQALEQLRTNMPNGEEQANEYRALRIVRELGPEASAEDFQRAAARLETEINASRESGVNQQAIQWQQWVRSSEQVMLLSKASKDNSAEAARQSVDELTQMAEQGNLYARNALSMILLGSADGNRIGAWLDSHPQFNNRPNYIPNFQGLDQTVRDQLLARAAQSLDALSQNQPLSQMEASALAMAAARAQEQGSQTLRDSLTAMLERQASGPQKDAVLNGIMEAFESGAPGSAALARAYLNGIDGPLFQQHFERLKQYGITHNEGALRILAAVAAGRADGHAANTSPRYNPISEQARTILDQVGERPGMRARVVEAILFNRSLAASDSRFNDNHRLMATLGRVASLMPDSEATLRDQARTALRESFIANTAARSSESFLSAQQGMLSMARHWNADDGRAFVSNVTPEVVQGLSANVDRIPQAARDVILQDLQARINSPDTSFAERIQAMRAMGTFGKYLSTEQVEFIRSFGGDLTYNPQALVRLRELGITGENQVKDFQATAAEALLNVLTTAPNSADPDRPGPREAAYNAFRDVPWPLHGERPGQFIEGRDSRQLRDALVNYYQGRPFDAHLAAEINRIVDTARLPRPAADIMRRLGIGNLSDLRDPERLRRAEQIIRNYSNERESGDEVLRRVVSNLQALNAEGLPGYDRARIMGWNTLSDPEKQVLGYAEPTNEMRMQLWLASLPAGERESIMASMPQGDGTRSPFDNLTQEQRQAVEAHWQGLSNERKEEVRWMGAVQIDPVAVLGQMYNRTLEEPGSPNRNLLGNIDGQLEAMRMGRAAEVERLTNELNQLNIQRNGRDLEGQEVDTTGGAIGELSRRTAEGVSFGRSVLNFLDRPWENARDRNFTAEQNRLLDRIVQLNQQIEQTGSLRGTADQHQHQLAVAREVGEYHRLLNSGDQVGADRLAIRMWQDHGPALAQLAPSIWRDLTVSTDNTLQGASMLRRLRDRGQAQWDLVPGYLAGTPEHPEYSLQGFRQALGLENAANAPEARGLMQLSRTNLMDTPALRAHMLGRVDQDPVLRRFSDVSRNMNGPMEEMMSMFIAAQNGTIYENFIDRAKEHAHKVQQQMESVTREDLNGLAERIRILEQARDQMRENPNRNQEAFQEIERRIATYKNMHNTLNRFDENPRYPEVCQRGENGEIINPNKNLRQVTEAILDNALQPSTFTSWMKENGVLIGVTLAAVAATVAACATFGVSSPAAVGLWVAVAGLAAKEITNEVLYQVNSNGYTGWGQRGQYGSRYGNWLRTMDQRDSLGEVVGSYFTDVVGPYAFEVGRDWAAFVVTAGLSNYLFPIGQAGRPTISAAMGSVFRSPPPGLQQAALMANRAALMESGQMGAASANFMRQFMGHFGRELLFNAGVTTVQMGVESQIHEWIGPENLRAMTEHGQWGLSFAISTGLALAQGARGHMRLLSEANMRPGNHMEFQLSPGVREVDFINHMRRQGFEVSAVRPGQFEVRPFGAPAGTPPYILENMAARGDARPPADLLPPGHANLPGAAEPRPGLPGEVRVGDGNTWTQTPEGTRLLTETRAITDAFMRGDIQRALELASDRSTLAPLPEGQTRTIVDHEVAFNLDAYHRAPAAEKPALLQRFLQDMGRVAQIRPNAAGNGIDVTLPRPVVEINGVKINIATGEMVMPGGARARMNPETGAITFEGSPNRTVRAAAENAVTTLRERLPLAQHQRILAEQTLIHMEERLHMQHNAMGERAFSPRYTEFVRDMMGDSREHTRSLDGSERTASSREQEAILALYDAGWPLDLLQHHFGAQHAEARRPVFDYLRARDALNSIPDPDVRALVRSEIDSASPQVRRQLLSNLPEIMRAHGNGDAFMGKIEQLKNAAEFIAGAHSANTQEMVTLLNGMRAAHPEIARDPILGRMIDQSIAEGILKNPALFDGAGSVTALRALHTALEQFQLPGTNSAIKAALSQRIEAALKTNKARNQLPIEAMAAIATRFGLDPALLTRINSYNPERGAVRTEIVGTDVMDAFVNQDPGRRSASFDTFRNLLETAPGAAAPKPGETKPGPFRTPHDVANTFGANGADPVPGEPNTFYIDVGGNNYRVKVRFDYSNGRAEILSCQTHAQYDRN